MKIHIWKQIKVIGVKLVQDVYIGLVASLTIDDQKEQFIEKKIEHDKWERLPPS
jgi:phosphoribosylformylglycinamidine (FGAM) synthase PurS component